MQLSDVTIFDAQLSWLWRLLLAALLGAVLGWERERQHHPAGLRTYILVTVGSALFTIVSIYGFVELVPGAPVDPSRVAAQIVTGIGFLGAGTVLRQEHAVQGLTTAAGIWLAAAIGMTVATGMYAVSIFATLLAFAALTGLRHFETHTDS